MLASLKPYINQILCGDAYEILKQLPDSSIDSVITSPPYWALRDYGVQGQIGLESSFEEYISNLCNVFDQIGRVLKKSGTCWIILGDTYSTRSSRKGTWGNYLQSRGSHKGDDPGSAKRPTTDVVGKCLLQLPARFAIEMISRGWILRNEVIWHKPNCMPSSAKDRFTIDFEKVFFFVRSRRYFFKQQFEELRDGKRSMRRLTNPEGKKKRLYGDAYISAINPKTQEASRLRILTNGRNRRCVWQIATRPFRGKHFAVYPPQLIETPMKAGCPQGGIVLDPFIGSGTTAIVAQRLGRNFIGIDLNPEYVEMARKRLTQNI